MRHRRLKSKLGVKSAHRKALLRNLVKSLVRHKQIRTTLSKAREASAFFDALVQIAKKDSLHARRVLISKLGCPETARRLMVHIAPCYKDRNGGYSRVLRLGPRANDGAEMALLEFTAAVEFPEEKKKKAKKEKKKTKAAAKEDTEAKEKPKKAKKDETPVSEKQAQEQTEPSKKPEKKETDKRGGFLGTLRKFLKGDE